MRSASRVTVSVCGNIPLAPPQTGFGPAASICLRESLRVRQSRPVRATRGRPGIRLFRHAATTPGRSTVLLLVRHRREMPNQSMQRTRPLRSGCNRQVSWAGSLIFVLGRHIRSLIYQPITVPIVAGNTSQQNKPIAGCWWSSIVSLSSWHVSTKSGDGQTSRRTRMTTPVLRSFGMDFIKFFCHQPQAPQPPRT